MRAGVSKSLTSSELAKAGSDGVSETVLKAERSALVENITLARRKFAAMR